MGRSLKQRVRESEKVREIYLDLDDTLNTFTSTVGVLYGVASSDHDLSWCRAKYGYDLIAQVSSAYHAMGRRTMSGMFDSEQFWHNIPAPIWERCPKAKHCDDLITACLDAVGPDNVFIATSPSLNPNSASGKVHWINTYVHPRLHRSYHITPRKEKLAAPGRLLIDDCQEHLDNWEARGGTTFRVPKPWNQEHYNNGDDTRAIMEFTRR